MPGQASRALAAKASIAHIAPARGPGGRGSRKRGEESPGSTEKRCRVTPGGFVFGGVRESATESIPPAFGLVREKGCGKSAPRGRQRKRHGKPHRVQDRIGAAHGPFPARRPGWLLEARGNPRPRGMVAYPCKGWTEPGLQVPWQIVLRRCEEPMATRRSGFAAGLLPPAFAGVAMTVEYV